MVTAAKWVILLATQITERSEMKHQQTLKVIKCNQILGELFLQFFDAKDEQSLFEIKITGYINARYIGTDYYDIFLKIRKDIESSDGVLIACFGSMKKFFVTGLSINWSNGLKGYLMDELTLRDEQFSVYKPVNHCQYSELLSCSDQKTYREKFLKENQERISERNNLLDEDANRIERKSGGVDSIKGFPKMN